MHQKTLAELAAGLRSGDFSSVELTRPAWSGSTGMNAQLNSFITVTEEQALAAGAGGRCAARSRYRRAR